MTVQCELICVYFKNAFHISEQEPDICNTYVVPCLSADHMYATVIKINIIHSQETS